MFDASRWVLVEAWLSLGLRMRWAVSYESTPRSEWIRDEDSRLSYVYEGNGEWIVRRPGDEYRMVGFPQSDAPQLSTETMRHELAHYLMASEDDRQKRNFGLAVTGMSGANQEAKTLLAEQVIDAMIRACSRVVDTTLSARRQQR